MRSSLSLLVLFLPGITLAQVDPQVASLSKLLAQGTEPHHRVQAARLLGESEDPEAVPALCTGLQDASAEVRAVAARGLELLQEVSALECLEARKEEPEAQVQVALQSALKTLRELKARPPRLYMLLDELKDTTGQSAELVKATQARLRRALFLLGAQLASEKEKEGKKALEATLRKQGLKGYRLMAEIRPGKDGGLMLSVLCMSYPGQKLMGSIQVRASEAEPYALLAALAPQAIEEARATCSWELKGEAP
jgi:hypothetical protein